MQVKSDFFYLMVFLCLFNPFHLYPLHAPFDWPKKVPPQDPTGTKSHYPGRPRPSGTCSHGQEPSHETMTRWLLWWWRLSIRISDSDSLQTHESTLMAFRPFALWRLVQVGDLQDSHTPLPIGFTVQQWWIT